VARVARTPPSPTRVAALIVPDLVHPFFAELAKGLTGALGSACSLVIASSEESAVDARMQCLHPAFEDLRKSGHIAYRAHRDSG